MSADRCDRRKITITLTGRNILLFACMLALVVPGIAYAKTAINGALIKRGTVSSRQIKDLTVATRDLARGAVTTAKLASRSVTGVHLVDGTVTSDDLADGGVRGVDVADGGLTGADLADGSLTGAKLSARSVTKEQLADPGTLPLDRLLWGVGGSAANPGAGSISARTVVDYQGHVLPAAPTPHVIAVGGSATQECPGSAENPDAARGHLCIYLDSTQLQSGTNAIAIWDPFEVGIEGQLFGVDGAIGFTAGSGTPGTKGFLLQAQQGAGQPLTYMFSWAVRA